MRRRPPPRKYPAGFTRRLGRVCPVRPVLCYLAWLFPPAFLCLFSSLDCLIVARNRGNCQVFLREGGSLPLRHLFALPLWCPEGGVPRRCRFGGRWRHPAGGLLSLSPAYPAFSLPFRPHPPAPLPLRGRGRLKVILCKGLRPLHPRGLNPGGTCLPSRCGARRGACPGVAGSAGVGGTLRGACFLCRPPTPPLACLFAPIPPPPFPSGEGGDLRLFYARGFAPCIPGIKPPAALTELAEQAPAGG